MSCRLIQNIKHTCDYTPGGITNIYLLDIRDFVSYRFANEGLHDAGFVEYIQSDSSFLEIGAVNESNFTESYENGVYKQDLSTFVRTLSGQKLSNLLVARANKYVVAFRTSQGQMFCFGSDGGASLSFTQITGQIGETSGYQVALSKISVYPLFEVDPNRFDSILVLATEGRQTLVTEDADKAILV